VGGQKSLCVSLSALRLRSAVHSRQHVVCPAVWPVPGRTWGSKDNKTYLEMKITLHFYLYFIVFRYTPPLRRCTLRCRVSEKIILFSSTMKIKLFSVKISMKFLLIFYKIKKWRKEWFFHIFIKIFIAHFFFKKKK
jgi:hypothetical protein